MPNDTPLVSLLMAAYNAAEFVADAVQSVVLQTYDNWELIVVDDGSTDATADIVARFDDPRIKLLRQTNGGVSSARNRALSFASGSVIGIFDSDDLLPPDSLEIRLKAMRDHSADIVSGGVAYFAHQPLDGGYIWQPDFTGDPFPELLRLNGKVFFSMSYLMRVEDRTELRFDESMTHAEDLLFWTVACSRPRKRFCSIPEVVYHYRQHSSSAMRNLRGLETGYWQLYLRLKQLGFLEQPGASRYLRLRITRIMLLSYLRAGKVLQGLQVPFHALDPSSFLRRSAR